jgi:hypothetical protein
MPAPVSPDAERLMELHEAVVAALRATYKAKGDEAWLAACEDLGRAKAAFREALFAQPDAGAMAEATRLLSDWLGSGNRRWFKPHDALRDAIATALTRREAAGFARGVEAVCKIANDELDQVCRQINAAEIGSTERMQLFRLAGVAERIRDAARALLGEGKE